MKEWIHNRLILKPNYSDAIVLFAMIFAFIMGYNKYFISFATYLVIIMFLGNNGLEKLGIIRWIKK